jgi:hypothetical protein
MWKEDGMQRAVKGSKVLGWGLAAVMAVGLAIGGCGGGSQTKKQEAEPVGSLKRTFTLVDEQGRKSGTLVLSPMGGAELRDMDGQVIGKFQSTDQAAAAPAAEPATAGEAPAEKKE